MHDSLDDMATRPGLDRLPIDARRHTLVAEVGRRLSTDCGLPADGRSIVVGVSGGADSLSLLLAAVALRDGRRMPVVRPIAAYVHHHLRSAADDELRDIAALCGHLEVPFEAADVDLPAAVGVASAARDARYMALGRIAEERGASTVAVAHHAGDQMETMLMALCRGAGLSGLAGMPWRRPLAPGVDLIRPLLATPRAECEAMCNAASITWHTDASNATTARGRLRREVIPTLDSMWRDNSMRTESITDALRWAASELEKAVTAAFGPAATHAWSRGHLRDQPRPVITAGLRRSAIHMCPEIADSLGQSLCLAAAAAIGDAAVHPRTYDWPGGLTLKISARTVELVAG